MNEDTYSLNIQKKDYIIEVFIDPFNKRIRVDDYRGNVRKVLIHMERVAKEQQVEKMIVKAKQSDKLIFIEKGFTLEGIIDNYFLGSPCFFFTKYFTLERRLNNYFLEEDKIMTDIYQLTNNPQTAIPPKQYMLKQATEDDVEKLASLYEKVFEIYPTPLNDPAYIKRTMQQGTIYFYYSVGNEIVSAASAEINDFYKNAEITDCATLPKHRKFGLLKSLILQLEEELAKSGIFCMYSIARALSFGMNAALYQLDYRYRGRLINNCFIFNKLEDMNVWVKNNAIMPSIRQ